MQAGLSPDEASVYLSPLIFLLFLCFRLSVSAFPLSLSFTWRFLLISSLDLSLFVCLVFFCCVFALCPSFSFISPLVYPFLFLFLFASLFCLSRLLRTKSAPYFFYGAALSTCLSLFRFAFLFLSHTRQTSIHYP